MLQLNFPSSAFKDDEIVFPSASLDTDYPEPTEERWHSLLRSMEQRPALLKLLEETFPNHEVAHVRTAHYASFRATPASASGSRLLRLGIDPDNQRRERRTARLWARYSAPVVVPLSHEQLNESIDMLTLPWLHHEPGAVSTEGWLRVLQRIREVPQTRWTPGFSNLQKSMDRLAGVSPSRAGELSDEYGARWVELQRKATRWSWVHGDLHIGNVIRTDSRLLTVYDLDTSCWAPSVWDLTHLTRRLDSDGNSGYDPEELRIRLGYSREESQAALALRETAATIAKLHRDSMGS